MADYIKYGTENPSSEIFFLQQPRLVNFYINMENGAAEGPFEMILEGKGDHDNSVQILIVGDVIKGKFQGMGAIIINGVTTIGEELFPGTVDATGFNCAGEFHDTDLTSLTGIKHFHVVLQKNFAETEQWSCFGC